VERHIQTDTVSRPGTQVTARESYRRGALQGCPGRSRRRVAGVSRLHEWLIADAAPGSGAGEDDASCRAVSALHPLWDRRGADRLAVLRSSPPSDPGRQLADWLGQPVPAGSDDTPTAVGSDLH